MRDKLIYRIIVLCIVTSLVLVGCNSRHKSAADVFYNTPTTPTPEPLGSCEILNMSWCDEMDVREQMYIDVKDCQQRALNGDVLAMEKLATIYHAWVSPCQIFADKEKALEWWKKAREAGSSLAVQKLSTIYAEGKIVRRNRRISDAYIKEGVEKGYDWAVNKDILRKIRIQDKTAINDLIQQAISGNRCAQARLSGFYAKGEITILDKTKYDVKINFTKAYFWDIIAGSPSGGREPSSIIGVSIPYVCQSRHIDYKERKQIPVDLIDKAEEFASIWTPGDPEPNLPHPKKLQANIPEITVKPDKIIFPDIGEMDLIFDESNRSSQWQWFPIALPKIHGNTGTSLNPADIFEKANKYVWKVFSAKSKQQLMNASGISQGSAVAISEKQLLTNCHIISGNPIIIVKQKDKFDVAQVVSGDSVKDQCILEVASQKLIPVSGIRTYASLKTGEAVFTIGSPSGLDNSLGEGIVSGLRKLKDQRLIQTTAQISPGSSGGGLFDQNGNLIGITTFMLRESQALNFAIAIEEYGE